MRRRAFTAASLLAALVLVGCKSSSSVHLTVVAGPTLPDAVVASIGTLEVAVSGADTGQKSYPLDRPFSEDRQERILVKTAARTGELTFAVLARNRDGVVVAHGKASVPLVSGEAAAGTVELAQRHVRLVAGALGGRGYADDVGAAARFFAPSGLAVTGDTLLVTDRLNALLRSVSLATATVETIIGAPRLSGADNGPVGVARLNRPRSVVTNGADRAYVTDGHAVREVILTPEGRGISTLAGLVTTSGARDGDGMTARFNQPDGLALDAAAGKLYVADSSNHTIREVTVATGEVALLAGLAGTPGSADGTGTEARFNEPHGVALDGAGNLFVADTRNHTIRKIVLATKLVSTVAGTASSAGTANGTGAAARFNQPRALAVVDDTLFIADRQSASIRKMTLSTGNVTTLATQVGTRPIGLAAAAGAVFFCGEGQFIGRVDASTGAVTPLAGSPMRSGDMDGSGEAARLFVPHGLAVAPDGTVYLADRGTHRVKVIDPAASSVTAFAGDGEAGYLEGIGTSARFNEPFAVAADAEAVYVTDKSNHVVRRIDRATREVTTLAGMPGVAGAADGMSTAARFSSPRGIALDDAGNAYVCDTENHTIRRLRLATKEVETIAGSPSEDEAPSGSAWLNKPTGVVFVDGALYVTDNADATIKRIDLSTRQVAILAGAKGQRGSADGPADVARFSAPLAIAAREGALYISDSNSHTIRTLDLATKTVSTYVGTVTEGRVRLGPLPTTLNSIGGLAFAADGTLLVAVTAENAVLAIGP